MRTWWKQLVPYLVTLSVVGNLYLGWRIYDLDSDLNRVTWGNSVDNVWKHIVWANMHQGGQISPDGTGPAQLALEEIQSLRSLPYYSERVVEVDLQTLEQFLRYANKAYELAAKEQSTSGKVSRESEQRLAKVKEGLNMALRQNSTTNRLKNSVNPWNHAGWRGVWHDIAEGLRAMEFVPLPE